MRLLTRMKLHIVLSKFAKILPFGKKLKCKCILLIIRSVFPSAEKRGHHTRDLPLFETASRQRKHAKIDEFVEHIRGSDSCYSLRSTVKLLRPREQVDEANSSGFGRNKKKKKKKKNNSTSSGPLRLWRFSNILFGEITSSSNQASSRVYKCSSIVLKIWF